jgi:quercetin dioxygenase-like cupin family protein
LSRASSHRSERGLGGVDTINRNQPEGAIRHDEPVPGSGAQSSTTTEDDMQITRNSIETMAGPADWFTGKVYVDTVTAPTEPSRLQASSVHFAPGARTAWHTHPNGQTIYVTEGVGLCQQRGGQVDVIKSGDRVFFEPGESHWHGAAPDRFMTHLAMLEVDEEGNNATWGDHVTDEEYGAAPSS